eukprot:scaffold35894_cov250-Skeletonema_dohrnii-CCMP3373.AAC.3
MAVSKSPHAKSRLEKGELKPGGPGLCPRTPVGPAGYGSAAIAGGWRTLRCRCRRGRTVGVGGGGSGFLGWVWCRSGRRISDGRVWRKTTMRL